MAPRSAFLASALTAIVAIVLVAPSANAVPTAPPKDPIAIGSGGAVSSVDPYATEIGLKVLQDGGNAVDAAVATAAALGVTEPYSAGVGGGGFFVYYDARSGKVHTIDGRETAPADMKVGSFLENGTPIPFAEAVTSGLSVGVPGTPATWELALDRWGSIDLKQALRPAAQLAQRGFVVDETFQQQTAANAARFAAFTSTRELFLPGGAPPEVGSVLRNPDLALTYTSLGARGTDYLYEGRLGEEIVATVTQPPVVPGSTLNVRPGLMRLPDLDDYRALLRAPTLIDYRGLTVAGMAPPSSGGSTVGEALNILEGSDLAALARSEALHRYLEATALAFADRNRYVGDPAFVDVPLNELLSQGFADERACLIEPDAATKPVAPGSPDGAYAPCAAAVAARRQWWRRASGFDVSPHDLGPVGERCFIHAHDRTDRRIGHRCPEPRIPAEQRADRFQLCTSPGSAARSEPAGSGQTASLVDEPHHRARRRGTGPGDRLAGWLDDHHHRCPDAAQPARFRNAAARRGRCSASVATEHRGRLRRACLHHDLGGGARGSRSQFHPRGGDRGGHGDRTAGRRSAGRGRGAGTTRRR